MGTVGESEASVFLLTKNVIQYIEKKIYFIKTEISQVFFNRFSKSWCQMKAYTLGYEI